MGNKKAIINFQHQLCRILLDEGATYSSIVLTKNGNVISSYSTNEKWEILYHESGLSKNCHLIETSKQLMKKSNQFTAFWDLLQPNNDVSIFLNQKRKENKICHGVSFCMINANGVLEVLSIAGRYSDMNFSNQVIKHKNKISKYLIAYKRALHNN